MGTRGEATGDVGGVVEAEGARVVVLPEPPPVGETVQIAEGWFRLDEAPDRDDNGTGSFAVVAAQPYSEEPPDEEACAALAAQAAACEASRKAGPAPAKPRSQPRKP